MPVTVAIIGAVTAGISATGGSLAAQKKSQAAKEATKGAMISGITDVIKAREARKAEQEAAASRERAVLLWVIFGIIVVFGVIVTVVLVKRKKEQP